MSDIQLHRRELEDIRRGNAVAAALLSVGEQVAKRAAGAAPKRSGDGARSIRAETVNESGSPVVRVSWDRDHFYMAFQELGTSRMSARPFLRPALDQHYDV